MIRIEKNSEFKSGIITLPTSKSLSNRALIIRELAGDFNIHDISDSDDTQNLLSNLNSSADLIDVGAAGTNMRFLISLYAATGKKKTVTGSERMLQRPIGKLVEALRKTGANISYVEKEGFPPVTIHSQIPIGGEVSIDGSESSQFISSLLMIAPLLKKGLTIQIENEWVSSSYIQMTIDMMKYFGIECEIQSGKIHVASQKYVPKDYTVEGDWSGAGFWYGLIAASRIGTSIHFKNLSLNTFQGDHKTSVYFEKFGVETSIASEGIMATKKRDTEDHLYFDLLNEPDLFPVLAFTCASLQLKAKFTGLQTLNLKESKRIDAVAEELNKIGLASSYGSDYFNIESYKATPEKLSFSAHNDHRIAMAASIFCMLGKPITIENPEVITKSYPKYWEDLKNIRIANIY